MPVPPYYLFIEPVLRILSKHPEGSPAREVYEESADMLCLTSEDKHEQIPSGQPVYKNRAGWAHDRLKRAGYSSSPRRGIWRLTEVGRDFERTHPSPFDESTVETLAKGYMDVILRDMEKDSGAEEVITLPLEEVAAGLSPEEQIHQARATIEEQVVVDLLERLSQVTPIQFETIVLDLLHKMGYGGTRADLQQTQASQDGGIDGVISLDKLGLEKVYVQAKRWQGTVGRPELQAFYGALAGIRATKGIFITTSAFTQQAREFVANLEGLVLVNGARLARLMIEHDLGVSRKAVMIPELDSDYFEDG